MLLADAIWLVSFIAPLATQYFQPLADLEDHLARPSSSIVFLEPINPRVFALPSSLHCALVPHSLERLHWP